MQLKYRSHLKKKIVTLLKWNKKLFLELLEFGNAGFRGGENQSSKNKLKQHMKRRAETEHRPYWLEAGALTTVPS